MSVHKKPNGTWFVQYRIPGIPTPQKEYYGVGAAGAKLARKRDAEIQSLKTHGKAPTPPKEVYLDELAQAYLAERKMCGVSETWLVEMQALLNTKVLPSLCSVPVDELKYSDIVNLSEKEWEGRKHSTKQRYLGYLKALFNFGVVHDLTTNNPLGKWHKSRESKYDMQLTLADFQKLLSHASPHFIWAMEVEWELGVRPGNTELFKLRWQDVNFERCLIKVKGTKTASSDRILPITPAFRDRLFEKRKGAQCDYIVSYRGKQITSNLNSALKAAKRRAGLTYRIRLYDVRHLFASTMLAAGADLAAVSRILGHSDIATTQAHYYHLMAGEMTRAISTRPALNNINPQKLPVRVSKKGDTRALNSP